MLNICTNNVNKSDGSSRLEPPSAGNTNLPSTTTYLAPVTAIHSPAVSVHVLPSSAGSSVDQALPGNMQPIAENS